MMRAVALCAALVLVAGQALADGPYKDGATSAWFQSLHAPQQRFGCCDQADCKQAQSDYRQPDPAIEGEWWAHSNQVDTWVRITPDMIVRDPMGNVVYSIFPQAILCEGGPSLTGEPRVYCFAPPPLGF